MVVEYGPSEGDGEERDRFWNDMDRIVDRVGNGYRLCKSREGMRRSDFHTKADS